MKGKLVCVAADQTIAETQRDSEPTLEEYQQLVGGYIESVRVWWDHKPRMAFVNEDGKRLELPYNARASYILCHPFTGQKILGNLVIWIEGDSK